MLEADFQDLAVIAYEPAGFRTCERDGPIAASSWNLEPGAAFVGSPGCGSGTEIRLGFGGDHDGVVEVVIKPFVLIAAIATIMAMPIAELIAADVSEAKNRSLHGRLVRKSPGFAAILRRCCRSGSVRGQITAAENAVPRVAEGHGNSAGAGRADERRVIRIPTVAAIFRSQDSCDGRAAGGDPGVSISFCGDAGSTCRKRSFARKRRRHIRGDRLPRLSISGANVGKYSIHRIAVRDAAVRSPERKTIVERVHGFVRELDRPGRAAVRSFVDFEIRGVIPDGHQIGDFVADALHVAELQTLGSGHDAGFPVFSAVRRDYKSAASAGSPNHAVVHRADVNQQLGRAAGLRRGFGLMNFSSLFREGESCRSSNQKNGER